MAHESVNPVRNSSGALNPAGIILKSNPAAEQRGIISNGVNKKISGNSRQRPSFYSVPYLERGHQTSKTFVILGQGFG